MRLRQTSIFTTKRPYPANGDYQTIPVALLRRSSFSLPFPNIESFATDNRHHKAETNKPWGRPS